MLFTAKVAVFSEIIAKQKKQCGQNVQFLGAFTKLGKGDYWLRNVCLSVRPSFRQHGTFLLPLDGFS